MKRLLALLSFLFLALSVFGVSPTFSSFPLDQYTTNGYQVRIKGSGVTNLPSTNIVGTITNTIVSPSISGNGFGLTNIPGVAMICATNYGVTSYIPVGQTWDTGVFTLQASDVGLSNAIAAAAANKSFTWVLLPPGVVRISNSITLYGNVGIRGVGRHHITGWGGQSQTNGYSILWQSNTNSDGIHALADLGRVSMDNFEVCGFTNPLASTMLEGVNPICTAPLWVARGRVGLHVRGGSTIWCGGVDVNNFSVSGFRVGCVNEGNNEIWEHDEFAGNDVQYVSIQTNYIAELSTNLHPDLPLDINSYLALIDTNRPALGSTISADWKYFNLFGADQMTMINPSFGGQQGSIGIVNQATRGFKILGSSGIYGPRLYAVLCDYATLDVDQGNDEPDQFMGTNWIYALGANSIRAHEWHINGGSGLNYYGDNMTNLCVINASTSAPVSLDWNCQGADALTSVPRPSGTIQLVSLPNAGAINSTVPMNDSMLWLPKIKLGGIIGSGYPQTSCLELYTNFWSVGNLSGATPIQWSFGVAQPGSDPFVIPRGAAQWSANLASPYAGDFDVFGYVLGSAGGFHIDGNNGDVTIRKGTIIVSNVWNPGSIMLTNSDSNESILAWTKADGATPFCIRHTSGSGSTITSPENGRITLQVNLTSPYGDDVIIDCPKLMRATPSFALSLNTEALAVKGGYIVKSNSAANWATSIMASGDGYLCNDLGTNYLVTLTSTNKLLNTSAVTNGQTGIIGFATGPSGGILMTNASGVGTKYSSASIVGPSANFTNSLQCSGFTLNNTTSAPPALISSFVGSVWITNVCNGATNAYRVPIF